MTRRLLTCGVLLAAVSVWAQEPIRNAPRVVNPEPIRGTPRLTSAPPKTTPKFSPKLEAIAETKLLMEGLNEANYRGLVRLLKDKPADDDTWRFARGQALLIAETGNLLLLRPPRNNGRDTWMRRATGLRQSAAALARQLGDRDYDASRRGLADLANACNRC